jgi:hypothetical protein
MSGRETMAWVVETYSMQVGHKVPEVVTGNRLSPPSAPLVVPIGEVAGALDARGIYP